MSLANIVEQRLRAAGIGPRDEGLIFIADWNGMARARAQAAEEVRRRAELERWRARLQRTGER